MPRKDPKEKYAGLSVEQIAQRENKQVSDALLDHPPRFRRLVQLQTILRAISWMRSIHPVSAGA